MLQHQRQQEILKLLEGCTDTTVEQLAAAVYASPSTVRRDLITLEQEGLVCRLYGGVMLAKYKNATLPLAVREEAFAAAKEAVAREAAGEITHGTVLFLDGSSTAHRVLKHVDAEGVTVITNSLSVPEVYGHKKNLTIHLTGGSYVAESKILLGAGALSSLERYHADLLLFSSQGITEDGIFDVSEAETALRREMMRRATRRVFLCDSSKVGVTKTHRLCGIEEIDRIICDTPLPFSL